MKNRRKSYKRKKRSLSIIEIVRKNATESFKHKANPKKSKKAS